MRSNKELLQLLLDNNYQFDYGLCRMIKKLEFSFDISPKEANKLHQYIIKRIHKSRLSKDVDGYYWEWGKWEPREEWLKQQIKILNDKRTIFTTLKRWVNRS